MLTLKWGTCYGAAEGAFVAPNQMSGENEEVAFQSSSHPNHQHELNAALASALYQDNAGLQVPACLCQIAIRF